ncbi:hypothetical protein LXL04_002610 [Taraxacum kok-saghyz]
MLRWMQKTALLWVEDCPRLIQRFQVLGKGRRATNVAVGEERREKKEENGAPFPGRRHTTPFARNAPWARCSSPCDAVVGSTSAAIGVAEYHRVTSTPAVAAPCSSQL